MLKGDSVRLKVNFKTFTGTPVDPINPTLTIYKTDETVVETIVLNDTNKINVGVFFMDYVPASELNEFIFEFSGTYIDKPIISRGRVQIKFI